MGDEKNAQKANEMIEKLNYEKEIEEAIEHAKQEANDLQKEQANEAKVEASNLIAVIENMSYTAWGLISNIVGVLSLALTLKYCFYATPTGIFPKASFGKDKPSKPFMHYCGWFLYWSSWLLVVLGFVLQLADQFAAGK
jgi:hypothetical protein